MQRQSGRHFKSKMILFKHDKQRRGYNNEKIIFQMYVCVYTDGQNIIYYCKWLQSCSVSPFCNRCCIISKYIWKEFFIYQVLIKSVLKLECSKNAYPARFKWNKYSVVLHVWGLSTTVLELFSLKHELDLKSRRANAYISLNVFMSEARFSRNSNKLMVSINQCNGHFGFFFTFRSNTVI